MNYKAFRKAGLNETLSHQRWSQFATTSFLPLPVEYKTFRKAGLNETLPHQRWSQFATTSFLPLPVEYKPLPQSRAE
ncbi:hypothetical protein DCC81_20910 [Chitinophaga parva]|uniref:Uncharacterized protein n=1 Tax=Chitinophaga parva TaxID=2169414 RepID=A0A2T7BCQ4_9BACT|nr:hypothetical protein DCC81_20910 [Chitinophaga parva]